MNALHIQPGFAEMPRAQARATSQHGVLAVLVHCPVCKDQTPISGDVLGAEPDESVIECRCGQGLVVTASVRRLMVPRSDVES